MDGEQFSLCWNNFHSNLSSGFHSLLQDEDLVDVTLAAEGRYIKAHKTVLSVCSPYFKELFRVNPCKHPIVILQDVNYTALSSLMQFMYQGEVSVSQDEIPAFMRVAETLKIKGLTETSNTNREANGIENETPNINSHIFGSAPDFRPNSQTIKRTRPVKKIIKPVTHLRPLEMSPIKSPPHAKSPQPPAKRLCPDSKTTIGSSDYENSIKPKQEPIEHEDYRENNHDTNLDMSTMLHTSISEPSPSHLTPTNWSREYKRSDFKVSGDMSSPGTLQCILGKRGNPRLIVDGHPFFKKSTYKGKSFWYCKHNRTSHKCPAVCWTFAGHIVKWPTHHTHEIIPDIFNPEDDKEVPIKHLHQVLLQAAIN